MVCTAAKAIKQYLHHVYGEHCWLCGKKFEQQELTLHHVIPKGYKGPTTLENSMVLCKACHFNIVNQIEYNTERYWQVMQEAYLIAENLAEIMEETYQTNENLVEVVE